MSASPLTDDLALARQFLRAGRCDEALAAAKLAFAAAERADDVGLMALSLSQIAWCCMKLGQAADGLDCVIAARRLWERGGDPAEAARTAAIEAFLLLDLGLTDEAFDTADLAVAAAERAGNAEVLAFACNAKGVTLALCRQPELAITLLERAVALGRDAGDEPGHAFHLLNLGFCQAKRADDPGQPDSASAWRDAATATNDQAIAAASTCGDLWTLRTALANGAELYAGRGDVDAALAYLDLSADLPGDPGTSLRIHYLYTLGDVLQRAGQLAPARAACAEALELAEASGQIDHQLNATGRLSAIHEAMGDFAAALALHQRFFALYVRQSGETTRQRAKVAEIRFESEQLRARATELADQALQDPLTGIGNRRSFDHIVARLEGAPYAVAIVDLDFFKAVNDRFSHLVGDAVLQRVAAMLVAGIGAHGHAVRLGGEEFALLFPAAGITSAAAFCDTIRLTVAEADWSAIAGNLAVTISIGLAAGSGDEPGGALLATADRRLYAAKAQGRNRVVAHDADALQSPWQVHAG